MTAPRGCGYDPFPEFTYKMIAYAYWMFCSAGRWPLTKIKASGSALRKAFPSSDWMLGLGRLRSGSGAHAADSAGRGGYPPHRPHQLQHYRAAGDCVFSSLQTIPAYPSGGGSFTVASENLGREVGLFAAAALVID
jgi:hypothetical protein